MARCVPFAIFVGMLVLGSGIQAAAGTGIESESAHAVTLARGVIVGLALAWYWPAYTELHGPAMRWSGHQVALAAIAGTAVFLAWIGFDEDWAVFSRQAGYAPLDRDGALDWSRVALRLAGLALVVPVMEELFWRSFLLRWIARQDFMSLEPRRASLQAIVVSTALFSLEHERWLAGAMAGAAYTLIYMRTGNLWMPILAHAVTNGILGGWIVATGNWQYW
jgi:CAAX prenyl protease-like protein